MDKRRFSLVNNIISVAILLISAVVYILTIEPTTSFWDCGEFIASSYKLEVGHPPGNPVFNIFARFFTIFTDNMHAAAAVNIMSALCSALTIFFLYLTIVHFGKRLIEIKGDSLTLGRAIALFGSGAVGALAFCFSDTFWFSAVEGEVYAMSSLLTAVVFWAILKWENEADERYANRWIVLISFLMGLSIGVHLLNLLAIPAIVFICYYKRHQKVTFKGWIGALLLSGALVLAFLVVIIPGVPRLAAVVDRIFVNGFGAPYNVGATIFMVILFLVCFWLLYIARKKEKVVLHTIMACLTTILIGYSTFSIVVIRSCADTPTNEYQPDNPYTLIRYLGREQYGKNPILYGQAYNSPYTLLEKTYYTPLNGKYHSAVNVDPLYHSDVKMFFPRMWSGYQASHKAFYDTYTQGRFKNVRVNVRGETEVVQMPKFADNLAFFFDYQVNYMYIRYFLWNFVGRQNDFHGDTPGDIARGNWESGIGFIDRIRLGDQSVASDVFANNRSKNHYYFLPLLLGLIGFFFQLKRDPRNCWVTGLLFLLTGLAIVVYLNQPPYQVRERDYAYAGSFYVFGIWIGLAVLAIYNWIEKITKKSGKVAPAAVATAVCLVVPAIMGCENWDDHDRSGRYTARDLAYNILMSTEPNALLVTHGDNDTFPLWYAQEVENVRTDVRVVNTSLLGTDWYIDQMRRKQYESEPLPITIDRKQYLYGTNDQVYVIEAFGKPILASEAIDVFRNPKYVLQDGKTNFIPAKTLKLPVNKENVKKAGIVAEKDYDKILDTVTLTISGNKLFTKTDLIILDILAHYDWSRPIYFVNPTGDVDLGLNNYIEYNGFSYKFVPIRNNATRERVNADEMYDKIKNVYRFESLAAQGIHVDYQNLYTFSAVFTVRDVFVTAADALIAEGKNDKALEMLDMCEKMVPNSNFPYNTVLIRGLNELSVVSMIEDYLKLGQREKALAIADAFQEETLASIKYFLETLGGELALVNEYSKNNIALFYHLTRAIREQGEEQYAAEAEAKLEQIFSF